MDAIDRAQVYRAYQAVFNNPAGEVVLEDMKAACHFHSSLIEEGQARIDPLRMAIAEGERNAVLRIMAILQSKEEDYGNGSS